MRAALLEASEKPLAIVGDVDIDEPRAGEVLVRVSHCGVCHSDLSLVNGTFPFVAPTVLGHEAAGVVDAVGAGVTSVAPGDKVVLTAIPVCNACYWCVRGEYGCCVNAASITTGTLADGRTPLSRQGLPVLRGVGLGGFAEYVITIETGAIKVAPDIPLDVACVIGCAVQTGVGAVLNTARVAGIMAAKRTHELIPLCHPLLLSQIDVDVTPDAKLPGVRVTARVKVAGQTGVEMEALTAVAVACLTIYDMVKAVERGMRIEGIRLVEKSGGRSGHFRVRE